MTVISNLAASLNRRDEVPNKELAKQLIVANDHKGIEELIENLGNKNKAIQNDCIKVLYEIGESKPALIAGSAEVFIALLDNKNNRLQWGAMTAIDTLTSQNPQVVYSALTK